MAKTALTCVRSALTVYPWMHMCGFAQVGNIRLRSRVCQVEDKHDRKGCPCVRLLTCVGSITCLHVYLIPTIDPLRINTIKLLHNAAFTLTKESERSKPTTRHTMPHIYKARFLSTYTIAEIRGYEVSILSMSDRLATLLLK